MKSFIKKILLNQGYVLSKTQFEDSGMQPHRNFLEDKKSILGSKTDLCILDVGAYIGQMSLAYRSLFPTARILALEPSPNSYKLLLQKTQGHTIETYQIALAGETGSAQLKIFEHAPANSLLPPHPKRAEIWGSNILDTAGVLEINSISLEHAFERYGINHLHLLKLDVQGMEYTILNSAKALLKQGRIDLIYLELILLPTYQNQETLANYFKLMEESGFELHNFYNLSSVGGQLRQVDALFKRV